MINTNYFTMGDLLRVCDEFSAWLVDTHGGDIFPNFLELEYGEPNFKRYYESVNKDSLDGKMSYAGFMKNEFFAFCEAVPEAADEIPVDEDVIENIYISVFHFWRHGDLTKQAIERLKKKYEAESKPEWLHLMETRRRINDAHERTAEAADARTA